MRIAAKIISLTVATALIAGLALRDLSRHRGAPHVRAAHRAARAEPAHRLRPAGAPRGRDGGIHAQGDRRAAAEGRDQGRRGEAARRRSPAQSQVRRGGVLLGGHGGRPECRACHPTRDLEGKNRIGRGGPEGHPVHAGHHPGGRLRRRLQQLLVPEAGREPCRCPNGPIRSWCPRSDG